MLAALALGGCAREAPLNVLIVSIDTLRADRLGCYGYARETSPALDRFARERAVRFTRAVAEAPWTLPSHLTLLTGLHPLTHGVRHPEEAPADEIVFLAQRLHGTHYTFGVTDGGWLSEPWGFARGFDSFHAAEQDVDRAVEVVLQYVRHRRDMGPWFAFLHTYDVHCPYDPPPPYAGRFRSEGSEPIEVAGRCGNPHFNAQGVTPGQARYLSDRYDEDVRRVDDALATLFAELERLELWDETIVIVTSDHGEEFLEYGRIGHEATLSPEVLSIPLLIHVPELAPRVEGEVVGLADLVPTVLELVGAPAAPGLDGRSLAALLAGRPDTARRGWVLSELAWKSERVARTTAGGREEIEPMSLVVDSGGLLKLRAEMLAAGYKPRPVDLTPHAAALHALGYF